MLIERVRPLVSAKTTTLEAESGLKLLVHMQLYHENTHIHEHTHTHIHTHLKCAWSAYKVSTLNRLGNMIGMFSKWTDQ